MARKKKQPAAVADVTTAQKTAEMTATTSEVGTATEAVTATATAVEGAADSAQQPASENVPNAEAAAQEKENEAAQVIDIGATDASLVMLPDAETADETKQENTPETEKPAAKTPRKRSTKKKTTPIKEEPKQDEAKEQEDPAVEAVAKVDAQPEEPVVEAMAKADAEPEEPAVEAMAKADAEPEVTEAEASAEAATEPLTEANSQRISKSKARRNRRKKAAQKAREAEAAQPKETAPESAEKPVEEEVLSATEEKFIETVQFDDEAKETAAPQTEPEPENADDKSEATQNAEVESNIAPITEDTALDAEPEEEEVIRKKRHYKLPIFAGFTAVVALGSMLFIFLLFSMSGSSLIKNVDEVSLPNFISKTQAEIEADAAYSKFDLEFVEVYSSEEEKGVVISQTPKPPKKVKENAHIVIRVSAGAHTISVPSIVGLMKDDAVAMLKESDLSALVKTEVSDTVKSGTVLSTDPVAGTTVDAGDTITIYVAGEYRDTSAIVPNIIGLTKKEASSQLAASNLSMGTITQVASTAAAGTVVSQSPKAGTSGVTIGSSVSVSISAGPDGAGIAADGHTHNYVTTVVAPNATSIGFTQHTCTICGDVQYDNVRPATG